MIGVLPRRLDDIEPQTNRHGYEVRALCDQFDAKPAETSKSMRGELDGARATELTDEMRVAGLPI